MLITRTDPLTGKTNSLDLPVTPEQFQKWEGGDLIQDAFWNLDSAQREFIKSGLISESWDKLFKEKPESPLPVPEEWASFGEIPIGSSYPPPPLAEKTWSALIEDPIQVIGEPKAADNEWVEESSPKKDKVEKIYSPPSGKIYSTKNITYHKFHKVRPVYKYLNQNIYLAGGSLRTVLKCSAEDVCDFDLFFKNLDEVQPLYDRLLKDGWVLTYSCPDGFLYSFKRGKHKIQLICEVEYADPHELLNSFDIAACIFCWHDGIFYYGREAVRSVFTKKLRVNNVSFPVATLKRLVKYANKGYNICSAAEDFCRQVSGKTFGDSDFRQYID